MTSPAALILAVLLLVFGARAQSTEDYELPPVNYSATQPTEIISRLQARLASSEQKFSGRDRDVVQALLRELQIPIESQLLAFSKTSLQRQRISPQTPRAIYFSDTCYVGWVPGGLLEVASIDPALGPVFYSFDPRQASERGHRFVRDADCLRCHGGTFVPHIPAVFARSVFPDAEGEPLLRHGTQVVDFRTPFEERWGGWFVTGKHGKAFHRGNVFAREKDTGLVFDVTRGANVTSLASRLPLDEYLTTSSDIVALLVFEHQLAMHNAITRAGFNCRRMLNYQKGLQEAFKEPITGEPSYDSVKTVFDSATRDVLGCLLFKDEAALPEGIEGDAAFQKAFLAGARRSAAGASLKDFHLKGYLFKNRCSYLIYSEAFLALPDSLKRRIYTRLAKILLPSDTDTTYAYLGSDERVRLLDILRETHPEFPKYLPAAN
jgi:hypothetical protein